MSTLHESWSDRAACRSVHPEVFFADAAPEHALAVCRGCPVRGECLDTALRLEAASNHHGLHGVWGGTTPEERRRMLDRAVTV